MSKEKRNGKRISVLLTTSEELEVLKYANKKNVSINLLVKNLFSLCGKEIIDVLSIEQEKKDEKKLELLKKQVKEIENRKKNRNKNEE